MWPTSQTIVTGLTTGCLFGLAGLGVAYVYRVTGLLNFAQGAILMWAGLLFARLTAHGFGVAAAAVIAAVMATAIAAAAGVALRPWFGRENDHTGTLLTIGLAMALSSGAAVVFGREPLAAPKLVSFGNVRALGAVVRDDQVVIVAAAVLISGAFWWWSSRTVQGKTFAALVDDPRGARLVGLRVGRLRVAAFAVGGLLAGLAGIAITPSTTMSFTSGDQLLLVGLTAAAVGGLGSPLAAIVGGVVVGLITSYVAGLTGSLMSIVVPTALLALVIAIRRQGLLGAVETRTL